MKVLELFDVLEESIFLCQDGEVVYHNPKAAKQYGDTLREESFKSLLLEWIERCQQEEMAGNKKIIQLKQSVNQNRYILSDISVMKYESGYLLIVHDGNKQDDFCAQLVHEMRGPLNIIQGAADLLRLQMTKNGEIKQKTGEDYIHHIKNSCQKLKHLIDNILDVAKSKMDFLDMHMETRPILPIVKDLVAEAAFEAGNKTVRLEYDPKIEDAEITFDPEKIERMISNLIGNAIKYTDADGVILVKALLRDENFILEVHDNGIGIREEDRESIFEPFERAANAIGQAKGTGIGLYLVKQFALSHNGDVQVESEEGVGSCFRVTLPVEQKSPR